MGSIQTRLRRGKRFFQKPLARPPWRVKFALPNENRAQRRAPTQKNRVSFDARHFFVLISAFGNPPNLRCSAARNRGDEFLRLNRIAGIEPPPPPGAFHFYKTFAAVMLPPCNRCSII
jgi:hypothetical protein